MIFAPERMVRLNLLALSADTERIAGILAKEGTLHLLETKIPPAGGVESDKPLVSNRDAINRLNGLAGALLQRLDLPAAEIADEKLDSFVMLGADSTIEDCDGQLATIRAEVDELLSQRQEAELAISRLDVLSEQMHLLHSHGLSFLDLKHFSHFYVACGTVSREQAVRLEEKLKDEPHALVSRPAKSRESAFLLMGDFDRAEFFDGLLREVGAHSLQPPERYVLSHEEALEQVELDLWIQRDRLAELNGVFVKSRTKWQEVLSAAAARLRVQVLLDDARSMFGSDGDVTLVSGFVPVTLRESLLGRLEKECPGIYFARIEEVELGSKTVTPTRLRNWKIFRPFEMFVKTYGLPGYNDVDPTPFVAISFLLMFGMMFGDVGHGFVLAAIGAAMAFLPYRALLPLRDLGKILMMSGGSGMLFGFLFGSIFGVESDSVLRALWMRPSEPENLTIFMGVALFLGVSVITLGIILNIVQCLRKGNVRKALIGQWSAASLVFFWGMLSLFGLNMIGKSIPLPLGMVAALLALPLVLITGGQILFFVLEMRRHKKGQAEGHDDDAENEEIATILFEPIEIVMNLFTNSVSFLRVAAFGLAHAALTTAIFVVNDMIQIPGASAINLPVGNFFVILMEGMIVTIQCLRLQYYEFFSKFFVGDGVAYTPLTIQTEDSVD